MLTERVAPFQPVICRNALTGMSMILILIIANAIPTDQKRRNALTGMSMILITQ